MERYAIITRRDKDSQNLKQLMKKQLDEIMIYDEKNPQLVISIGGDGTILHCIHQYVHMLDEVCFVGLHTGTLGFYTDYRKEDYQLLIDDIKHQKGTIMKRSLLHITCNEVDTIALNEVRVENNRRPLVLDVFIDHEHLETFRGNGLCISTASGSTAYNRSLGGAVIYPGVRLMQLSEIAGIHHNAYRSLDSSLILDDRHKIQIRSLDFSQAVLGVDQIVYNLKDNDYLEIELSKQNARFIQYRPLSFSGRIKRAFLK